MTCFIFYELLTTERDVITIPSVRKQPTGTAAHQPVSLTTMGRACCIKMQLSTMTQKETWIHPFRVEWSKKQANSINFQQCFLQSETITWFLCFVHTYISKMKWSCLQRCHKSSLQLYCSWCLIKYNWQCTQYYQIWQAFHSHHTQIIFKILH